LQYPFTPVLLLQLLSKPQRKVYARKQQLEQMERAKVEAQVRKQQVACLANSASVIWQLYWLGLCVLR